MQASLDSDSPLTKPSSSQSSGGRTRRNDTRVIIVRNEDFSSTRKFVPIVNVDLIRSKQTSRGITVQKFGYSVAATLTHCQGRTIMKSCRVHFPRDRSSTTTTTQWYQGRGPPCTSTGALIHHQNMKKGKSQKERVRMIRQVCQNLFHFGIFYEMNVFD